MKVRITYPITKEQIIKAASICINQGNIKPSYKDIIQKIKDELYMTGVSFTECSEEAEKFEAEAEVLFSKYFK